MLDKQKFIEYLQGRSLQGYQLFGAHFEEKDGRRGVRFTVFAPAAKQVELIGDFNGWKGAGMCRDEAGIWTLFVPEAVQGQLYKYRIYTQTDEVHDRADPFAFYSELRPNTASIVQDLSGFAWGDEEFLNSRTKNFDRPMNIYEVHPGAWKRRDGEWYSYDELGERLIPYVKENGYTHIELMPVTEYPFDGSWGYQATGYFSPTSRYGTPAQLMALIDHCHRENIGVILDFVPAHFVCDFYALHQFDGSFLYESEAQDRRYTQWGTVYFDFTKGHVLSFLMSSLDFWLSAYHFDGVRFDAVSTLIYQDGIKEKGLNYSGLWFLQVCNYYLSQKHPNVMLIAEDSSDYPKVTAPVVYGGLGFDYKWDLGWMNDTLDYMMKQPAERPDFHSKLTFSMSYFYYENFILPLSHDEVVHGKKTIIDKIFGSYEEKFQTARLLYLYMMTHPGKKLNFMGNELAHFREFDEEKELDWFLLKYPVHDAFAHYIRELNHLYLETPCLYRLDYNTQKGFQWIEADNNLQSVYAYVRTDNEGGELIAVMNFSAIDYMQYPLRVPCGGRYCEVLNTDRDIYAGENRVNKMPIAARFTGKRPFPYEIPVRLAPLSGALFRRVPEVWR